MNLILLASLLFANYPRRDYAIIADPLGYYPSYIWGYTDETLNIFLTTTRDRSCLIIKDKDFILSGRLGYIAEGQISFQYPGKYEFYCPSDNIKGTIHILNKKERL